MAPQTSSLCGAAIAQTTWRLSLTGEGRAALAALGKGRNRRADQSRDGAREFVLYGPAQKGYLSHGAGANKGRLP
jgi:hypothetical protein